MKVRFGASYLLTVAILLTSVAINAYADDVLIINGTSTTSEPSTTAQITITLDTLLLSQGHTTTISDPVPADISLYDQVWDIRFSPAISAGEQTQFVTFLNSGKNAFVMAENNGFTARNDSVLSLIMAAGGGALSFVIPNSTQNVNPAFRTPNDIDTITYCAPGGASAGGLTAGNGVFLSDDGVIGGSAIGFGQGSLTNAPSGSLAVVFDVNFMQPCGTNATEFLENLSLFVLEGGIDPIDPIDAVPVPTMSQWSTLTLVMLLAIFGFGQFRRRTS